MVDVALPTHMAQKDLGLRSPRGPGDLLGTRELLGPDDPQYPQDPQGPTMRQDILDLGKPGVLQESGDLEGTQVEGGGENMQDLGESHEAEDLGESHEAEDLGESHEAEDLGESHEAEDLGESHEAPNLEDSQKAGDSGDLEDSQKEDAADLEDSQKAGDSGDLEDSQKAGDSGDLEDSQKEDAADLEEDSQKVADLEEDSQKAVVADLEEDSQKPGEAEDLEDSQEADVADLEDSQEADVADLEDSQEADVADLEEDSQKPGEAVDLEDSQKADSSEDLGESQSTAEEQDVEEVPQDGPAAGVLAVGSPQEGRRISDQWEWESLARPGEQHDPWHWTTTFQHYMNALLADLQSTITPARTASPPPPAHNGPAHTPPPPTAAHNHAHNGHEMYHQERVEEVRTEQRSSGGGKKSSFNNNLSELDSLLQDLNNARYTGNFKEPGAATNGTVDGTRPSVDSLLDELNSVDTSHEVVEHRTVHHEFTTTHQTLPQAEPQPQVSPRPHPSASTATKELDDLMASLSDFKINASTLQTQVDSAYAKPQKPAKSPSPPEATSIPSASPSPVPAPSPPKEPTPTPTPPPPNQLDSMLGSLASHMTEQGITTTQKGCCCACDKPIVGQVITALGKTWHPEHFTCTHCNQELGTRNFFEREGRPYCEPDYHNLFSPRCAYCNGPILDKCVTALDKTWHPEHFFCTQCGNTFGDDGFHEKDGKPYCRDDYFNMFAPKCGGCNSPIMENYISALNAQWHPECFVCRDCRQPFNGGSFFDHEGLPYCETHYHAKRGSLCAGCNKPITGRCITAMFRKFHPEHFVCSFCLKQLNKGTFKEQNDKPYCHGCFDKLFG
ncbi:transforming growth factor beta-1-induced transcript 1 protein-like isoform X8 [Panulirus ornatus]|uniref:transforming growth factor beta-1-induced transcript 1 protein-like isoform X8 n=1 Tax=Panulirus ornatus TaxID=150431 RepID=UPI003A856A95